ncbi:MAG TPA: hypothetical protein VKM55_08880 [Candidatus Lokiarchaeia archaeon]|nr:hypothetical protein [Candidatus Lokiarchaeia archaeon]
MIAHDWKGYSLSIYHFNIQYVAGSEKAYHTLVTKSFRPFLDFYMHYPQFKASCEIQGHFIAFMGRYYPDDLAKLVELVMHRQQIELVSVHYSDQIYLAYPRRDLEESMSINDETLARYGLKRGGTFFAQENFFGPGVIPIMKEFGYKVALLNSHYIRHYQGEISRVPFFERDGIYFLAGGGFTAADRQALGPGYETVPELAFDYWGDGELAFTKGSNYLPGHGPSETKRLKRLALYINRQKNGYKTDFCTTYIDDLLDIGVKPEPLPLFLDGSWNFPSYGGCYLWMGRYRVPWERDGHVRSDTFVTRTYILAAEALLSNLKSITPEIKKQIKMAWKHLLLAEVSDSTGQTPIPTEVQYSFMESGKGRDAALGIIGWAKKELSIDANAKVLVDCKNKTYHVLGQDDLVTFIKDESGNVVGLDAMEQDIGNLNISAWNLRKARLTIAKPVLGTLSSPSRNDITEYYCYLDYKGRPTRLLRNLIGIFRSNKNFKFHVNYDRHFSNYVGFTVPLHEDRIIASLALAEDQVADHSFDEFKINETIGKTFLPLPNGLVGIGEDVYLIKHNMHGNTHIAVTIDLMNKTIGFLQDGPPTRMRSSWKFSIVKGPRDKVLERANEINVYPKIVV